MNIALALINISSLVSVIVCHIKVELIKHEVAYTLKELPLCSDCPSHKRDECNCGVCGSHGGCSFSCNVKSDKSIESGYFKCRQVFDKASQCKKVEKLVNCESQNQTTNVECEKILFKISESNTSFKDVRMNAIGMYNYIGTNKYLLGPVFLLIKNQQINILYNYDYARPKLGWRTSVYRPGKNQSWDDLRAKRIIETHDLCTSKRIEECRWFFMYAGNKEVDVNVECEKVVSRRKVKPNKT